MARGPKPGQRLAGRPAATLETTKADRERFLKLLAEHLNVSKACRLSGVSRANVYLWRKQWPSFAEEWEEAKQEGKDKLIEEFRDIVENKETPARDRLGGIKWLLEIHFPEEFSKQAIIGARTNAQTGEAEVIIAKAAPGVLDRLLSESPYLDDGDGEEEDDYDYIDGEIVEQ